MVSSCGFRGFGVCLNLYNTKHGVWSPGFSGVLNIGFIDIAYMRDNMLHLFIAMS